MAKFMCFFMFQFLAKELWIYPSWDFLTNLRWLATCFGLRSRRTCLILNTPKIGIHKNDTKLYINRRNVVGIVYFRGFIVRVLAVHSYEGRFFTGIVLVENIGYSWVWFPVSWRLNHLAVHLIIRYTREKKHTPVAGAMYCILRMKLVQTGSVK